MIKQSELSFAFQRILSGLYATYTFSIPLSDLPPYCLGGALSKGPEMSNSPRRLWKRKQQTMILHQD